MATETTAANTAANTTKPKRTTKTVTKKDVVKTETPTENTTTKTAAKAEKEVIVPKDVDLHTYIPVKNGFQGKLIYKSKKTGERFEWDSFGDECDMELLELRDAKSSSKNFFKNNWFMFSEDDAWVIKYLGVESYYKNALPVDGFDAVFEKSADEMETILTGLSAAQKRSVAYRARQMIEDGTIDSMKKVSVLEKYLGVELVEHSE